METLKATFVQNVTLKTGEEMSIYRTEGNCLIGLDGAFLEQVGDDETIISPYGCGEIILVD